MQRITPCLWSAGQAEEAVAFYTAIFPESTVHTTTYYDKASSEASGMPEGSVLTVLFELDGQEFLILNGPPNFQYTEALSLTVNCDSQDEVDHYWNHLSAGGEEGVCGWLKDRYGVSWQIVPRRLPELISHSDPRVASGAMTALMNMKKIDIATLERGAGL
ncbi:MAG: VOC family protein [Gammaproteobacteria bacterium]|jgi:predicted 3-demethylubiquinone-9 3-methyltransferase (glyoxalase superfamily)